MKYLNIVTLLIVAAVGFMVYKLWKASQLQTQLMTSVALKTGAVESIEAPKGNKKTTQQISEPASGRPTKKKLTAIEKKVMELFKDGIPKTLGEARSAYVAAYEEIKAPAFNNVLYNLKPSKTAFAEKVNDTNYWGPGEWFDGESFYEEYLVKIPGGPELIEKENENENA